jgi:hypothetical protein
MAWRPPTSMATGGSTSWLPAPTPRTESGSAPHQPRVGNASHICARRGVANSMPDFRVLTALGQLK